MNILTRSFLIALRIVIAWHFLYEGLWKIDSDAGTVAYATSWFTLQSSLAGLRDDLSRNAGPARVDLWYDEVVRTFKARNRPLAEDQKARLAELRDKVKLACAARQPDPVNFDWIDVRDGVLKLAAAQEAERFAALPFLQASVGPFRPVFRGLVTDMDGFERLTVASAETALDERYREILDHYRIAGLPFTADQRARLAASRDTLKTAIAATLNDPAFRARLADYRLMRDRERADNGLAAAPFSRERLVAGRARLDAIAGKLLGFVNEPLSELDVQSQTIATVQQLGAGPLSRPGSPSDWIDYVTKWGLTAIGACLLLGLFTPIAAVAAAAQLAMFYLASPPFPGLPAAMLGGHYLYVDRNLIELVAVCVVAVTGTGKWAGLDGYLEMWIARRRQPQPARGLPSDAAAVS
ncbi:MAG TPA: hypothetical protein VF767_01215 [Bryobacteraceae bacterium]